MFGFYRVQGSLDKTKNYQRWNKRGKYKGFMLVILEHDGVADLAFDWDDGCKGTEGLRDWLDNSKEHLGEELFRLCQKANQSPDCWSSAHLKNMKVELAEEIAEGIYALFMDALIGDINDPLNKLIRNLQGDERKYALAVLGDEIKCFRELKKKLLKELDVNRGIIHAGIPNEKIVEAMASMDFPAKTKLELQKRIFS